MKSIMNMKAVKDILVTTAGSVAFLLALFGGSYGIYLLVGLVAVGVAHIVLSAALICMFASALICLTIDIIGDATGGFSGYTDEIG